MGNSQPNSLTLVYYFYIRCPEQVHKNLFTVKSSDCSILLGYKLLRHIVGSEGIYVSEVVP